MHKHRYENCPVYQAEFAKRVGRMGPETAHVFATSRARWAAATSGMSDKAKREFADLLHETQQETWRREERDRD